MQINDDYPFGMPTKEEDEPMDQSQLEQLDPLTAVKLKIKDNDNKRRDRKYFTAFKLIVGCLVMLGLIYMIDSILSVCINHEISSLTKDIIEIIKTLLFTLSGYLFAKRENID